MRYIVSSYYFSMEQNFSSCDGFKMIALLEVLCACNTLLVLTQADGIGAIVVSFGPQDSHYAR